MKAQTTSSEHSWEYFGMLIITQVRLSRAASTHTAVLYWKNPKGVYFQQCCQVLLYYRVGSEGYEIDH